MELRLRRATRWLTKESPPVQESNLEQGNSWHWEQTSSFLCFTQQVMNPQEGCFSKKSGPAHPGHRELPAVWYLGHSPQSIPQQPIVGSLFAGRSFMATFSRSFLAASLSKGQVT